MKTAMMAKISMPYSPEPTPPKITSPSCISHIGTRPPSGVNESCIELTDPLEAAVVAAAHSAELAMPKRVSLPSMLPAAASTPSRASAGLPLRFGRVHAGQQHDEDDSHGRQHRPSLARIAYHFAEGVAKRCRNEQDRQHLQEVGERRWVLQRVRRVDVEEAAAVGAELLDRNLRGRRPNRDYLLGDRAAVAVGNAAGPSCAVG